MSKKIILLLSLFLIIFLACIASFVIIQNPQWLTQNSPVTRLLTPNPSPTPIGINSLSLTPATPSIIPGQINTVTVVLHSQNSNENNKPRIIQLEISYNPAALSDVALVPGDFFDNPTILLTTINERTGRISYALEARSTKGSGKTIGTVATISFTPNSAYTNRETTLSFLEKTMIRGKTDANILTDKHGTKLFFATGSATPKL